MWLIFCQSSYLVFHSSVGFIYWVTTSAGHCGSTWNAVEKKKDIISVFMELTSSWGEKTGTDIPIYVVSALKKNKASHRVGEFSGSCFFSGVNLLILLQRICGKDCHLVGSHLRIGKSGKWKHREVGEMIVPSRLPSGRSSTWYVHWEREEYKWTGLRFSPSRVIGGDLGGGGGNGIIFQMKQRHRGVR